MDVPVGEAEVEAAAHRQLSSPPEHPRVTRLRHRRLIAFLRDQGFHDIYNEFANKTRARMSLPHLRGLVRRGRWLDAVEYLDRYLPPRASPQSFRAQVLRHLLLTHNRFANAVDGIVDKSVPTSYLDLYNGREISHANLRLRSISFAILVADQVSLWSRRRYVKKQTGQPETIVRALKSQQLMVPSNGSVEEAKHLLADLLDETVRGGVPRLTTSGLKCPLQLGMNEGAKFGHSMFGPSTEAKTSGTSANAGAQFRQPMLCGTSIEAKSSGTLANAGINQHLVEAGCHTSAARQDLDGSRNSRKESTIIKLERDLTRQRLILQLGKASPIVVPGPGAVVNLGAKLSGVSSG